MLQFSPAALGPGGTAALVAGQAVESAVAERVLTPEQLALHRKMQAESVAAVASQGQAPWLLIGGLALLAWWVLR